MITAANINPAMTTAFFLSGKTSPADALLLPFPETICESVSDGISEDKDDSESAAEIPEEDDEALTESWLDFMLTVFDDDAEFLLTAADDMLCGLLLD